MPISPSSLPSSVARRRAVALAPRWSVFGRQAAYSNSPRLAGMSTARSARAASWAYSMFSDSAAAPALSSRGGRARRAVERRRRRQEGGQHQRYRQRQDLTREGPGGEAGDAEDDGFSYPAPGTALEP